MTTALVADARRMVTGFGSVRVQAGTVETRGLFDDAEAAVETPGATAVIRTRMLTLVAEDVPALAREDSISVGTLADDDALTVYRVVDVLRQADGILLSVMVAT